MTHVPLVVFKLRSIQAMCMLKIKGNIMSSALWCNTLHSQTIPGNYMYTVHALAHAEIVLNVK